MNTIEYPHPKELLRNKAFSQVVVARGTRTIYVSGQVSVDQEGRLIGANDLSGQTVQAMRNLGLALAAAGASFADIVKSTAYVVNYRPEHRDIIGQAKAPFFTDMTPPASALVGVAALALPEWLIEIDAVAVFD